MVILWCILKNKHAIIMLHIQRKTWYYHSENTWYSRHNTMVIKNHGITIVHIQKKHDITMVHIWKNMVLWYNNKK